MKQPKYFINGEMLSDYCDRNGYTYSSIRGRIVAGMSVEEAIEDYLKKINEVTSYKRWGMKRADKIARYKRYGYSEKDAIVYSLTKETLIGICRELYKIAKQADPKYVTEKYSDFEE